MAPSLLRALPLAAAVSASSLYSNYSFNPLHHLGGIAPYFQPSDPEFSPDAPQGCKAERAAYLVRHAAIYANDFDYEEYIEPFVEKLGNKTMMEWEKIPYLNFLASWKPPVDDDELELLTRVGRLEATQLGVDLDFRYPGMKTPKRGLRGDEEDVRIVSINEGKESGADSLTPYKACPAYEGSNGAEESSIYQEMYAKPIVERFNDLAPDFNFTVSDIFGMQQLCGYETVIRGKSPFCNLELFTPDDWLGWEYTEDVRYHYNAGYGFPAAGYVGMPWVNATADILMSEDRDQETAQDLTVSFTHRELPPMVLVAMGLFNNSQFSSSNDINATMPNDKMNPRRAWKSSHVVPFLTNIAIERFNCTGSYGFEDGDYYRVLVNSAPQVLPDCSDGPGTSCSRKVFKSYIEDRVNMFSGFSEECNVDYKNSTDVLTSYEDKDAGEEKKVAKSGYKARF